MNTFKKAILVAAALLTLSSAHAVIFELHSDTASKLSGNPGDADFADIRDDGDILGDAAGLYTATLGGSASTGFFVEILFGSNPQPELTSAFIKAGNNYLLWDSADLATFNAGTYTGIKLFNDGSNGIKNPPGNAYQGTSHAGLEGTPGTTITVPDGGATAALLGLGVLGLTMFRRKN